MGSIKLKQFSYQEKAHFLESVKAIYGYFTTYEIETMLLDNTFMSQTVILIKRDVLTTDILIMNSLTFIHHTLRHCHNLHVQLTC